MAHRCSTLSLRRIGWLSVVLALMVIAWPAKASTQVSVGTWLGIDEIGRYNAQFAALAEALPGIELDIIRVGAHRDFAGNVLLLAATGSLPDILQIPPEHVAPLVEAGLLTDLQPLMESDPSFDNSRWLPGALDAIHHKGITFGIPLYVVNYTYVYNDEIFNQRGLALPMLDQHLTWEEIRENARKTTVDLDGDGAIDVWGYYQGLDYDRILPLVYQAGGEIFAEEGLLQLSSEAGRRALTWVSDLIHADRYHPPSSVAQSGLIQGTLAAARFGSWQATGLLDSGLSFGVAAGTKDVQTGEVAYVTTFAITRDARDLEAAWEILKWMASGEAQGYVVQRGQVPIRTDLPIRDLVGDDPQAAVLLQGFMNSLAFARSYPYHVYSDYITQTFNNGMWPVFQGEKPAELTLVEVEQRINAFLRQQ